MEGLRILIHLFDVAINNSIEQLRLSPDSYDNMLYEFASSINDALLPISSLILLLYFAFDFFDKAIEFKLKNIKPIISQIVKAVISVAVLNANKDILMSVFYLGNKILEKIKFTNYEFNINYEGFEAEYNALSLLMRMSMSGILIVTIVVILVAIMFVKFAVISRMIEIYIYLAFAPLAFCSFISQTTSRIGKDFISNFITVVLKASVLTFILYLYKYLIVKFSITDYTTPWEFMFSMIFLSVLIITLIAGTDAISRKIVGSFR